MTKSLILDHYREVQPCLPHFPHSLKDKYWISPVCLWWAYGNAYRLKSSEAFLLCSHCLSVIISSCLTHRLLQLPDNSARDFKLPISVNLNTDWDYRVKILIPQRQHRASLIVKTPASRIYEMVLRSITQARVWTRCFYRPVNGWSRVSF